MVENLSTSLYAHEAHGTFAEMTKKLADIWQNDKGETPRRMGYKNLKAKGAVLETRDPPKFKLRIDALKESLDAYDKLSTKFNHEVEKEWMEKKTNLLKKAEVAEAEALFLYCLKMGAESEVTAETLCSRARSHTKTDIFESMLQPLKDAVEKAEEYKPYK